MVSYFGLETLMGTGTGYILITYDLVLGGDFTLAADFDLAGDFDLGLTLCGDFDLFVSGLTFFFKSLSFDTLISIDYLLSTDFFLLSLDTLLGFNGL